MHELILAAERIVSRGGPLTMSTVAAEAGVSRATAYRRTGGKARLLEALEDRGVDLPDDSPVRERVLEAVRRHIAHGGLLSTSIEGLAQEVGVHPVSIYRLFGSREALLREALSHVFPFEATELVRRSDRPPRVVLVDVAAGLLVYLSAYPGLVAQLLVPASAERRELMRMWGVRDDLTDLLVAYFERCTREGSLPAGSAVERTGALIGLCLGAGYLRLEGPLTRAEAEERAQRLVRRFFQGEPG